MTDVVSITYKGVEYTMRDLSDMPMVDLIELHNDLAQEQGLFMVQRFENRTIGMKRTWDRLLFTVPADAPEKLEVVEEGVKLELADAPAQEQSAPETAGAPVQERAPVKSGGTSARKKREMYFNFPVKQEIKPPRKGTLRDVVLQELLADGLTFAQVIEKVKEFDANRAAKGVDMKGSDEHPERRAYEIVRIIHYWLGYGLRQSPEGVITAFDKRA